MVKTAIVIGSSGLTGSLILDLLIKDNETDHIILLTRRPSNFFHLKVTEYVVDFSDPESYADKLVGNCIFCCIGTTIKKAGTKPAFHLVDYTIPVTLAEVAAKNVVPHFLLVSSLGANPNSTNFYLRTKGECEQAVVATGIQSISIFRPSMLLGQRKETRPGEIIGKIMLYLFKFLLIGPLKKYRSIKAETLASAMVNLSHHNNPGVKIYESDEIETIASNKK